jgi:hypothetical protein
LVVLKWNLSLDLKADVLEAFEGRVYALAEERGGGLNVFVAAPLTKVAALQGALDRIALGSALVAGTMPSLVSRARGGDTTYVLSWPGFIGSAAFAIRGSDALAYVSEAERQDGWPIEASRTVRAEEDTAGPVAGGGTRSLVLRIDCTTAAAHIERVLKAVNVDAGRGDFTAALSEAGGTITLALRVEGADLVAWGEWDFDAHPYARDE